MTTIEKLQKKSYFRFLLLAIPISFLYSISTATGHYENVKNLATTLRHHLVDDPRTVDIKDRIGDSDFSNLRYLIFGTSRSNDRSVSSFSKLLSNNKDAISSRNKNLASSSSPGGTVSSSYASQCCYSMMGRDDDKKIYDVIILEFSPEFFDATLQLAKRLRQRFPKAYIIILEAWALSLYYHIPTGQSILEWVIADRMKHNVTSSDSTQFSTDSTGQNRPLSPTTTQEEATEYMMNYANPNHWKYPQSAIYTLEQRQAFENSMTENGIKLKCHMVIVPSATPPHVLLDAVSNYHNLFVDLHYYSDRGHVMVADSIRTELRRANVRTRHNQVNPWDGNKDQCDDNNGLQQQPNNPSSISSIGRYNQMVMY